MRDATSSWLMGLAFQAIQWHMRFPLRWKPWVEMSPVRGMYLAAKAFSSRCTMLGVPSMMGAVGTSADNALAETFKTRGAATRKGFYSLLHARRDVFAWCVRYNH